MNDLISRSKLINDIVTYLFSDKCNLNELGEDIRESIDSEPTAYDVDKVVGELKMEMKASSGYSAERVSAFSRAIEIVKQGGVFDDVCEWKMDNVGASIGCRSDLHYTGYVNRTYCPYCGKKIKVVE